MTALARSLLTSAAGTIRRVADVAEDHFIAAVDRGDSITSLHLFLNEYAATLYSMADFADRLAR